MIGSVHLSASHRGTIYTQGSSTYALLNGQLLSRTAYPNLSLVWPEGAYGSTTTTMVLPDLSDEYYLRGHDFGAGVDPSVGTRTTPSGIFPAAPSGIGTFQTASMATHTHPSGNQTTGKAYTGGTDPANLLIFGNKTTGGPTPLPAGTISGAALTTATELSHTKCYMYIRVS
jgi:hypothetical protein